MIAPEIIAGIAVLATGTFALRIAGPLLRSRIKVSPRFEAITGSAAACLLVAVAVTGAVFAGAEFAGWARAAGAGVGVLAALLRAPLPVVVILAAATAAGLRALGIP